MKKIIFLFILSLALLASCKKECTGATIEVTNSGVVQLTLYCPSGNIGVLPGETASFQLPAESWQTTNHYRWAGSETMHEFVTTAEPCETVTVELRP